MSKTGAYLSAPDTVPAFPESFDSINGIPVAVKDLISVTDDQPTTAASKILEPYVAPYQATVIDKLEAAGGVPTGKTNLDEFAMGSSTENSALGETTNPWDESRVPGGSSGGSAAAVASGSVPVALGTDTGGSVRQPAAFCGVVGLKPTYGRISRYGIVAFASSLDQVGIFSRTPREAALTLTAVSGVDPHDATTVDRPVPEYAKTLSGDVEGMKIGLPKEYFVEGLQPEVEQAVRQAADELTAAGAAVSEVSLPHTEYAIGVYYLVGTAEASSNLARYDGIRYGYSAETDPEADVKTLEDVYRQTRARGFGPEVKRRVMLGTYVLSAGYYDAYYKKAMQVRTLIRQDFDQAFTEVDLLLTPTTPTTAFKRGEKVDDPLQMYLNDILTVPASLAGLPAISVPAGVDQHSLPIGVQLIGPQWSEETVLRAADVYAAKHPWQAAPDQSQSKSKGAN